MENETVLVIGADGFIGKEVCKQLEEKNYEVIKFDRKINPNQDTLYFQDLPDADYVINLAGLVGLKHCLDNPINAVYQNLLGTVRLLEYFSKLENVPERFIHISTWATEGNLENPYDITKLAAENMVMSFIRRGLIKGSICRLGTTYGKGMSPLGVIPTMLKLAKQGKPLTVHGRGDQIRQFTHVSDIASGIITVMEVGKNGEKYYIVSDEITSIIDIAKNISDNITYLEKREGDENYNPIDNKPLKELGWIPRIKFKEGIKEMKEWINEVTNG